MAKWIAATKWTELGGWTGVLVSYHSFSAPIVIQKWSDGWYATPDKSMIRSTDPKWDELPYEDVKSLVKKLESVYSFNMDIGGDVDGEPDFS